MTAIAAILMKLVVKGLVATLIASSAVMAPAAKTTSAVLMANVSAPYVIIATR